MKSPVIVTAVIALAAALPGYAQTVTQDKALISDMMSKTQLLGACQAIGFSLDSDLVSTMMDKASQRLSAAGVSDTELHILVSNARSLQEPVPFIEVVQEDPGMDNAAALQKVESAFTELQSRCEGMTAEPRYKPFLTKAGYQATMEPKSFFGLTLYQAEKGNADKWVSIGNFYDAGVQPDPDHVRAFTAYSKAAEAGDAAGADLVAGNYFSGEGVTRDLVEAEKWAVIAAASGIPDIRDAIEHQIPALQVIKGKVRAQAWLEAHGKSGLGQ